MLRRSPSPGRIVLTVLAGSALFVGLATFFAYLLRPYAPTRAAKQDPGVTLTAVKPGGIPMDGLSVAEADALGLSTSGEDLNAVRTARAQDDAEAAITLPDAPLVAIVMTELGTDVDSSRQAIDVLPAAITFTFTPYADLSPALARQAQADGHEVFVSVPMEPQRYPTINPGENTLLRSSGAAENLNRLDWALDRFDELDGTTGMMGSAFTQDAAALKPVMKALHLRGLTYIDARASGRSVAEQTARESGVPSRSNDRFLDEPATQTNIDSNLAALFATAKRRGHAVGYARPTPTTIAALSGLDERAKEAGITLIGAARLARGLQDQDQ